MEPTPQQVSVDSTTVIEILRQKLADLDWQNTLLQAEISSLRAEQASNAPVSAPN